MRALVVIHDTGKILAEFDSILLAEAYITGLEVIDGVGVSQGKYVIDADEEVSNG